MTTANHATNTVNLPDQVKTFLQDVNQIAPPDALYVIEMGRNDLRDALAAYFTVYPKTGSQSQAASAANLILTGALNGIALGIQTLHHFEANKFLVWNAPRIDLVPAVQNLGPGAVAVALSLVAGFNQGLAQIVSSSAALGIQIAQMERTRSRAIAIVRRWPSRRRRTNAHDRAYRTRVRTPDVFHP
ncbi:hypothetical protein [Paraburkholderia sp. LEh10]|uniref:hypothetical protein n=1 Tax=Paraburkholderia sp. LEh10 TaxID=2821353 RepID=UPI001FD85FFE|nr:hypothetical protein [Paraburkholderia sp. LEh10]